MVTTAINFEGHSMKYFHWRVHDAQKCITLILKKIYIGLQCPVGAYNYYRLKGCL